MDRLTGITRVTCATALFLALQACAQTSSYIFPKHHQPNLEPEATATTAAKPRPLSPTNEASLRLAKHFFVNQRFNEAFESLLPLAIQGDPDAQYSVGYLFYYGKGVTKDQETGKKWIQKSAAQGFPNAEKALQLLNIGPPKTRLARASKEASKRMADNQAAHAEQTKKFAADHSGYSMKELLVDRAQSTARHAKAGIARTERFQPAINPNKVQPNDITQQSDKVSTLTPQLHEKDASTNQAVSTLADAIAAEPLTTAPDTPKLDTAITSYGPIKAVDTLWSIARTTRPNKAVSIQQMMMAILHENPQAFTNNNINALKKGSILTIPSIDQIARRIDRKSS